jgi:omega-6 fatty acid desaturase (delta-12 desaturase)
LNLNRLCPTAKKKKEIPRSNWPDWYPAVPALQAKAPLTIRESLSCFKVKVWDEERREMAAFP